MPVGIATFNNNFGKLILLLQYNTFFTSFVIKVKKYCDIAKF